MDTPNSKINATKKALAAQTVLLSRVSLAA
ncbi:hypothetical protein CCNA_03969 [Caulobacter vibrioides NA1000]|uniref:Uncharacterized protein n=1 Tax=Caulobacter vibrioides (strain NA1000 / CB15N) TaxID=565050 RepID=A0A0H3J495_CAUVN|nr:hypothetical protein [Caulobacter vibrioides]YP_009020541.1 hypothetical protein CCNA_03969 [Caulobacter vibrioides NA1000]AHI88572.1 hypothetical protein CCNA_03969 [Caulobacter vibrioides NA1000]